LRNLFMGCWSIFKDNLFFWGEGLFASSLFDKEGHLVLGNSAAVVFIEISEEFIEIFL